MADTNDIRGSKNLGLIKAIHAGINPPSNTKIIWYDDNVGVKYHKFYDTVTSTWIKLGSEGGNVNRSLFVPMERMIVFKREDTQPDALLVGDFITGIIEGVWVIKGRYEGGDPLLLESYSVWDSLGPDF